MGYNGAKSGPCYPILARSRSPKYELLMMHFLTEKTATPLIKRNSAHVILNRSLDASLIIFTGIRSV